MGEEEVRGRERRREGRLQEEGAVKGKLMMTATSCLTHRHSN